MERSVDEDVESGKEQKEVKRSIRDGKKGKDEQGELERAARGKVRRRGLIDH